MLLSVAGMDVALGGFGFTIAGAIKFIHIMIPGTIYWIELELYLIICYSYLINLISIQFNLSITNMMWSYCYSVNFIIYYRIEGLIY